MPNKEVTDHLIQAPEMQSQAMLRLRALIAQVMPDLGETFKWGRAFFASVKDFVYFKTGETALTSGFFDHKQPSDHDKLPEGTGASIFHIRIKYSANFQSFLLTGWMREAAQ
jgi:hypothetical protein